MIRDVELEGFPALELANDALRLAVIPELGAKIARLASRASGREWLFRNPHLSYRRARDGDSYVALHDTGGIDECFPTVAPTAALPDHGELWAQPWELEVRGTDRLVQSVRGVQHEYVFRRALSLPEGAAPLALDYTLENRSPRALPFVWCLHALFALEPGMRIELPDGAAMRVDFCAGDEPFRRDDAFAWPGPDLATVPGDRPLAAKLFAGPLARGRAALRSADGKESLRFDFDPAEIPFVGLWLNYRRWSGAGTPPYFNLALEPGIGDSDSLDVAQQRGTAGMLASGATRRWRVELGVYPQRLR